jgi:hypothetical protein
MMEVVVQRAIPDARIPPNGGSEKWVQQAVTEEAAAEGY